MSCLVFDQVHFPGDLDYPPSGLEWSANSVTFQPNSWTYRFVVYAPYREIDYAWVFDPLIPPECRPDEIVISLAVPQQGEYPTNDSIFFSVDVYNPTSNSIESVGEHVFVPMQLADNEFTLYCDWSGVPEDCFIARIGFDTYLYSSGAYTLRIGELAPEAQQFWTFFNRTKEVLE